MPSGTSVQGAVAFGRDVTVELTSYRPKGTPQQGDQGLVASKEGAPTRWGAPAQLGPVRLWKLGLEAGEPRCFPPRGSGSLELRREVLKGRPHT